MTRFATTAILALGLLAAPFTAQAQTADRAVLENDVRVLADDALEGRESGTRGFDEAAQYVAGRFASIGLQPGGDDDGWYQAVPLARVSAASDTRLSIVDADGNATKAVLGEDFYGRGAIAADGGRFEAPLVFVGRALDLPEHGYDDLATVDLEGAIAVYIYGEVPGGLNSEQAAHLQSSTDQRLAAHGAIGSMIIWTDELQNLASWDRIRGRGSSGTSTTWVGPDGVPFDEATGFQVRMGGSPELARQLLEGTQLDYDALNAAIAAGDPLPSFPIGKSARVSYANERDEFATSNVIGVLPGSDPSVADEYVVVTAHLDHVGIGEPGQGGDRIFNGAMDNASGVATILELARLLAADPPRRPVMFVALGAEEMGLLGSSYHANNPGLERGELVANVNYDMPILTYPFGDIVAFGAPRSNMFAEVERGVTDYGLVLADDPNPGENFFVRSDQYSYVQAGIPAVYLDIGWANDGEAAQTLFLENHYHRQSDEADRLDYEQLGRFADVGFLVLRNIANMAQRPEWNEGDFFGETFGRD